LNVVALEMLVPERLMLVPERLQIEIFSWWVGAGEPEINEISL